MTPRASQLSAPGSSEAVLTLPDDDIARTSNVYAVKMPLPGLRGRSPGPAGSLQAPQP